MFRLKIALITIVITCAQWAAYAPDADAGLLRDWLQRARQRRAARRVAPVNNFAYAGLQPGQCQTTCQQACSRVVVNYVPCTSYRTTYERVPVTQYRPQTSSDPCTGCTVTCMRPCTTYTYRTRRVPYTTYRPVYRTETYRVPVTTVSNDCNTCAAPASACNNCATGFPATMATGQTVPSGTITTDGTFSLPPGATATPWPTPADSTPSIINPQDSNRSVVPVQGGSSTRFQIPQQNKKNWSLTSIENRKNPNWSDVPTATIAANSPVTRKWTYTPVKQASYVSVDAEPDLKTVRGQFVVSEPEKDTEPKSERLTNQGWQTVDW